MEEGCYYYIYNRGINSERIFKEEKNYSFFLERFQSYVLKYVDVYAYCLMPTHFHFLVYIQPGSGAENIYVKTADVRNNGSSRSRTSDVNSSSVSAPQRLTNLEQAFRSFFTGDSTFIRTSEVLDLYSSPNEFREFHELFDVDTLNEKQFLDD